MRIVRLWRHLKLLKRAGTGMLVGGIASAQRGSCAVECPACPQVNTIDPNLSDFLNTLFVMLDGNFRLKCKNRSLTDPALGSGLASFVEEGEYDAFLKTCGPQPEVRCQLLL